MLYNKDNILKKDYQQNENNMLKTENKSIKKKKH